MLFKYFTKKNTNFSLFYTILLGTFIHSDFSESHQVFASASEVKPEAAAVINSEQKIDYKQSNKYLGMGLGYALKEELETAIENFNKAIAFNPESFSAHVNRGNVYLQQSKWDQALADYDRAIEINPKLNGRTYYNRGSIYTMRGKLQEALADYNMAIKLKPSFYPAYFLRGDIHLRQENWLDAVKDFEQVIELEPNKDQAYFAAGFGYLNMQEWDKALKKYNQGILINPNDGSAYFNRGFIHANNGYKVRARIDWQKAEKIFLEQKDLSSHQKVEQLLNYLN